jgi:hypothetical protein
MRVARLDATGTPITGANQAYIAKAPITVNLSPDFRDGVELESVNGCGSLCGFFKDQDQLKKYDVKFSLCDLDSELIEILTGVSVITSGGQTIGHEFKRVSSCDPITLNGVSLEFWSKRWAQCAVPTGTELYWHWALPRAFLRIGEISMENDFMKVPIEGFLQENPNWGDGPFHDFPDGGDLEAIGAVWEDTSIPDPICGWTSTPA